MEVIQVQPRDAYLHYIHVPTANTTISWSFTTKRKNIAFGLYRRLGNAPLPSSSDVIFRAQQLHRGRSVSESPSLPDKLSVPADDDKAPFPGITRTTSFSNASIHPGRLRARSIACEKLKDMEDLVELIPVEHCDSSNNKVEGSYEVQEPGNYILIFDNSFSRNTPKTLTFSVALMDPCEKQAMHQQPPEISGWLIKKRRKRLQGWAKRWFQLSSTGVLSYSTQPNNVTRGAVQILIATVSLNPQQNMIHIDTGTMIWHLRTLNKEDYNMWTSALSDPARKHHATEAAAEEPTSLNDTQYLHTRIAEGVKTANILSGHITQFIDNITGVLSEMTSKAVDDPAAWSKLATQVRQQMENDKEALLGYANDNNEQWSSVQRLVTEGHETEVPSQPHRDPPNGINPRVRSLAHPVSPSARVSTYSTDQFYDAEEILMLSSDDEDYAPADTDRLSEGSDNDDDDDDDDAKRMPPLPGKLNRQRSSDLSEADLDGDRRKTLPSPCVGDAASMISVFRKNVGKDLSQIAMPVSMNEPLSILQRACEELEYSELLDKAASLPDSLERLMYVSAFIVSSYASSQYRTGRKPFNPMLGETYENIRPDKGFRFIAEKVCHRPLMIAAYAESKSFKYWQCSKLKSKFWGKSMEFINEGTFHIALTPNDDHFTFTKPSSWMRNMLAGEKYLEHVGEIKVENHTTGEYAIISFKEGTGGGLFGTPTKRNGVTILVYDQQGHQQRRIIGKWSEALAETADEDNQHLSVLWRARPPNVENYQAYYGLTRFGVELNEITNFEKDKLPCTDTRLRPDQRLLEQGQMDAADQEKQRIEQKQRDKRKELESKGMSIQPQWFELREDKFENPDLLMELGIRGQSWQYTGQYWPTRDSQEWPDDLPDLW